MDVIVAGAGPVGLLLAAELALAGAEAVVLERLAEPARAPKARGIGPLAFEALRRRGLGDRIAAHHPDGLQDRVRDHGTEKGHFAWIHKLDPLERQGALIWQPDLEAVLAEYAAELGVKVLRGREVTALTQDEDGVTVEAGGERFSAAYAVGCDGGHSAVRGLAGFDFPGIQPIMTVRRAQADYSGDLPPQGRTPYGTLFHGPGVLGTFDFDGQASKGPITAEELQDSVRRVSGTDVIVNSVGEGIRFTDYAAQATTYRRGRVLLAGDAAHVHSPNGGQGLNLGLLDATNLGWKLAAAIAGEEELLDTYTAERHPVGAAVLHNTLAQSALMRPGPHTDALRDIVGELMELPEVNRYFGELLAGLRTRYDLPGDHPLIGTYCPDQGTAVEGGFFRVDGPPALLLRPDGVVVEVA
ncbi:FAD-dependent monooxygenase [Nonomuraea sp. NPDC050556]|uniref:FAD-dependent monooxygenase n=1 Tax=Nonomuraea sp. NPDC050556 TaxID=3364369 RepID=UPI00379067F3